MMKIKLISVGLLLLAIQHNSYAQSDLESEIIQNCKKTPQIMQQANTAYQNKKYASALNHFQQQAAWLDFCSIHEDITGKVISQSQLTTAYNNVGISHQKLGQSRWARAWYAIEKNDPKSQFNLKNLPQLHPVQSKAGIYAKYIGQGVWDILEVTAKGQFFNIDYQGYRMGANGMIYGPNIGEFSTQMAKTAYQARYQYDDECMIQLNFARNLESIDVTQNQTDCGFGMGVYAEGHYSRVENLPQ